MEIKEFDRDKCKMLRAVTESTLQASFAEVFPGVAVKAGSGKFSGNNYTLTLEFALEVNGNVMTQEAESLVHNARWLGLPENPIGLEFENMKGERFKLVGYKRRNRTYPIIGERIPDGRRFKFPENVLNQIRNKGKSAQ